MTPTHRTTRDIDLFRSGLILRAGATVSILGEYGPDYVVIQFDGHREAIVPADAIEPIPPAPKEETQP